MGLLTIPVVAVAQGPVSVVVLVVVTYEYCLVIRCNSNVKRVAGSSRLRLDQEVLTTVLVPELMVDIVVDGFTDRQEQPLLMRDGVGYALM